MRTLVLLLALLLVPQPASANAGVPMIFITLPGMIIALIPIIAIETLFGSKLLRLPFTHALKTLSVANVASTLAGIPLTWVVLVALQLLTGGGSAYGLDSPIRKVLAVTWQAPWLIPYESDLYWMVPSATLVLLVPFFFASWLVEYLVVRRWLTGFPRPQIDPSFSN